MLRVLAAQGTILQLVARPPRCGLQAVSAKSRTSALVVRCANSRRVDHRALARAEIARVLAIGTYKAMQSGVLDAVPASAAKGSGV
jgi:hypothetical protein